MLRLNRLFVAGLLLTGIVFPNVITGLKFVMFAGAILSAVAILISDDVKINRNLFFISLFYGAFGLLYSCYGEMLGNPGATRVLTVMLAYPLLFPILAFTYRDGDAEKLFKVFFWAAWVLVAIDSAYILANLFSSGSFIVDFISNLYKDDAVIDNAEDYFKFTLPNISSLIFLIPFFISAFFSGTDAVRRSHLVLLILLMSALAILSGRRALLLIFFVGPIIAYCVAAGVRVPRRERTGRNPIFLYVLGFVVIVVGFLTYFNLYEFLISQATSIFEFRSNSSNIERAMQFDALIDGIVRAPLFGSGAGAAANYSRSATQPWAYELSYIAFIFQYGLVGFFVYLSGIMLLMYGLLRSLKINGKSSFQYFFLSGFISFLFANATNPYLATFDYMWVVFVPFAILVDSLKHRTDGSK